MSQKTMKIGVIGAGAISDIYLTNMIERFDNLEVIGVAARRLANAEKKAENYGIRACTVEELLAIPEIDMIVVLTPVGTHAQLIRQALLAGTHVYTEKTITDDLDSAKELLTLANERGLVIGCAPDPFLGSALQTGRKAIEDGLLGEITGFSAAANRCNDVLLSLFPFLREPGAGIALDYGVYYITALVSLLGPVARTAAFVRAPYPTHVGVVPNRDDFGKTFDTPNESQIAATLQMESGVTGTLMMDADTVMQDQAHMVIYGTKGMLYLCDPNGFGGEVRLLPETFLTNPAGSAPVVLEPVNPYSENSRGIGPSEMADAILNGRRNRTACEMAVHVLDVLASILKSGETGTFVNVETTCEMPAPFYAGGD